MDMGKLLIRHFASALLFGVIFLFTIMFILLLVDKEYLKEQFSKNILEFYCIIVVAHTLVNSLIDFIFKF